MFINIIMTMMMMMIMMMVMMITIIMMLIIIIQLHIPRNSSSEQRATIETKQPMFQKQA